MTTTNPTLVIVDETKPMLRNPQFAADFLQVGLMEGRKLRKSTTLATIANGRSSVRPERRPQVTLCSSRYCDTASDRRKFLNILG